MRKEQKLEEFTLARARALAQHWHCGLGQMYELASTGRVTCRSTLVAEVDCCVADLTGLHRQFPGDRAIAAELARMKQFHEWARRPANDRDRPVDEAACVTGSEEDC